MPEIDFDINEAADYLGVSPDTLCKRRFDGMPPTSYRDLKGRVRYTREDLDKFVVHHRASTTVGAL